ncbi:hypothetical protein ES703_11088 [subsurface metagenome]
MANYYLKGVDDEQWKRFKASCDLQGITIKEFFIDCINTSVKIFQQELDYHKTNRAIQKLRRKKK